MSDKTLDEMQAAELNVEATLRDMGLDSTSPDVRYRYLNDVSFSTAVKRCQQFRSHITAQDAEIERKDAALLALWKVAESCPLCCNDDAVDAAYTALAAMKEANDE